MTIRDILPELGISEDMIVKVNGDIDALIDKGYALRKQNILTGDMIQVVDVYPNVDWTDGTCRPTYGLGGWETGRGANIYLNTRI
jgi:sulfur carrier protein ThiS